ncbi:MAG: GTP-binding protein [Actinomycetota bacterium]|nr:GTP-binding protein [Actinomycetota bacterium]
MTRVPVTVITGLDAEAMAAMTVSLQWDLSRAVVVRHTIDAAASRLHRMVSDVTGIVEEAWTDLEHACTSCALREDILPTLGRLAGSGNWDSIIAHLPVTAEALQVCRSIALNERLRSHLALANVITVLNGETVRDDLLGDDLLRERGLATSDDDSRGVGEVACAMVEYADLIVAGDRLDTPERELLDTLRRPDAVVISGGQVADRTTLVAGLHDHQRSEAWIATARREPGPDFTGEHAWTIDLSSWRPFHPGRLLANIEALGGGARRIRGCFWVPTRPYDVGEWDGAGGQVSVGIVGSWRGTDPLTRLIVTGLDDDRDTLREVFEDTLLSNEELSSGIGGWAGQSDGLEPWLGEIDGAA